MSELTLTIGNKNYSSWSLRAWLATRKCKMPFTERLIQLSVPSFAKDIAKFSPSRRVPVLQHGGLTVWDSLAIGEYLAELAPAARLWPTDTNRRAVARSVSAEMHSSFFALRAQMPMNIRARRRVDVGHTSQGNSSDGLSGDIARVQQIWRDLREQATGGPWLFGHFTIADAMYAPVASRFVTYGVPCDSTASAYRDTLLGDEDYLDWQAAALLESEVIAEDEAGEPA